MAKMSDVLSARQEKILEFIQNYVKKHGIPPSIRDIVAGCGISSTSVADYNLKHLERLGFIRRHHEISRGIELVDEGADGRRVHLIPFRADGREPSLAETPESFPLS